MLPVVFMDESGNKETDRFFVIGFLEIANVVDFNRQLHRIYDQVLHLSRYKRLQRVNQAFETGDLDTLYNFAKYFRNFEMKFDKVSQENIHFFMDLVKALFRKANFKFNALVIDRNDEYYTHTGLVAMYKSIVNLHSNHCMKGEYVFVPDMFDYRFDWYQIKHSEYLKAVIPTTSDASFPLQVVDVLTGIISLSLKFKYGKPGEFNNSEIKRKPLLGTLQKELGKNVDKNVTVKSKNYYFSVWTVDFSKRRGSRHGQETQP